MGRTLFLTQRMHPAGMELLAAAGLTIAEGDRADEAYLASKARDCDAMIVRGGTFQFNRTVIDAARRCLVIGRHGVGLDCIDVAAASAARIPVVFAPGSNSMAVAEHAVTLMLMVAKRIWDVSVHFRMQGDYEYRLKVAGGELTGKTLGLVGLGSIGRRVASICHHGFKMPVIGFDPYVSAETLRQEGLSVACAEQLEAVLAKADVLSLHAPGGAATTKLIGERELRQMQKGAIFVNTSRGALVDEAALYRVLVDGHLAGAGLDVFDPEPPDAQTGLLALNNVVATPHTAAHTTEANRNMAVAVARNVLSVLSGEKPKGLANPEIWERRRIPSA